MKICVSYLLAIGLALLGARSAEAQPKKVAPKNCIGISGTISGTVTSAAGASPTTVTGTVIGSLKGAVSATITSLEPQTDGTVRLKLNHTFVTDEGDLLRTTDTAKLTPVTGLKDVYQQSTEYKVTGGTGRFAAAKGTFINHGEADLGRGLLTLRYDGRICSVTP